MTALHATMKERKVKGCPLPSAAALSITSNSSGQQSAFPMYRRKIAVKT